MKVRLIKQVQARFASLSSDDVWLYRDMDLPFPPFVGLGISDHREQSMSWDTETLEEVVWRVDKGRFDCYVETDSELYEAAHERYPIDPVGSTDHQRLAEIVTGYEVQGWTRRGKGEAQDG